MRPFCWIQLDNIGAGKHFPRFLVPSAGREVGVDHRTRDRGVPHPILHKSQVCAGILEVRSNRVFEHMEVPLVLRDARALAIVLHEFIESAATDGSPIAREEQGRGAALALFDVRFERFEFIRPQSVHAGQGMLHALNADAVLFPVNVIRLQHAHLRRAQAVAVGEEEHGIIAFGVNAI
jgi:hypothetical protein